MLHNQRLQVLHQSFDLEAWVIQTAAFWQIESQIKASLVLAGNPNCALAVVLGELVDIAKFAESADVDVALRLDMALC